MQENSSTRGERNNNPMNIRVSAIPWTGKTHPNADGAFEQFDCVENGIRAGAKILHSYFEMDGLSTIDEIIARWAPSIENNSAAYADDVSKRTGYDQAESLNMLDPAVMGSLVTAIIFHENGRVMCSTAQIQDGVSRALAPLTT